MKAFYLAIKHTEKDTLWEQLKSYTKDTEKLILAMEVSKSSHQDISGEHFHVLAEWEDKTYEAFKKTVIDKHYKLCGKALKGGHRKYGIVRKIRDEDKMLSYTIKANNYIQQGYTKEELDEAYEVAFEKDDPKAYQEQLMEHLLANRQYFYVLGQEDGNYTGKYFDVYMIEIEILKHHMTHKEDKPLCKSKLEYYVNYYLQCKEPNRYEKDYINVILNYIKKRT